MRVNTEMGAYCFQRLSFADLAITRRRLEIRLTLLRWPVPWRWERAMMRLWWLDTCPRR